jgi:TPR repeat protein
MKIISAPRIALLVCLLGHTLPSAAWAAQGAVEVLLPPQVDYAKICKKTLSLTRDKRDWSKWDGKSSPLSGKDLTQLGRLYLKGSAEQPSNPVLAHKIIKLAAAKPGKHRGGALLMLGDTYAKGIGTAQDGVLAKQTFEEALKVSARGAGFALGSIYEKEGEFSKAADAYARDAANRNPAAALALSVLYKTEKVPAPRENAANEMVILAQNMLLAQLASGDCDSLTVLGNIYLRGESVQRDEQTAAKWLQAAALSDSTSAIITLATLYQRGVGVPHDREKVQQLWQQAATLGSPEAMYHLGFSYVFGDYVDQDVAKGIPWLEKAAERFNLDAMSLLHRVYRGDYGSEANYAKAMKWLQRAAEHPAAETSLIFLLGQAYEQGKLVKRDFAKAQEYYQLAAKLGDQDAPFKVGQLYQRGLGSTPEHKLALRFYRLAASRGNKEAMVAMYNNYFCGISVNYDPVMAQRWLDRAISNGSSGAIMKAQQEYQQRGTEKDFRHAEALLKRGVELNDRKAMIALAQLYSVGAPGVDSNKSYARELLEMAIAPGEDRAKGLTYMANLYLQDGIVGRDVEKAVSMLMEATKYEDPEALRMLGSLYMKGLPDFPADENQGLIYLQQSADKGNAQAMLALADFYRKNATEEESRKASLDWYIEAGVHGDPTAAATLAEYYRLGTWVEENPAQAEEWLTRMQSPESCPISKSILNARMYSVGIGAEKNQQKAEEWFARAMRIPPTEVSDMKALADAYANGYGTTQDYSKALQWETALAERGETRSMRNVARMQLEGLGTKKDVKTALRWYQKAAEAGDSRAYIELAGLYEQGRGVKIDNEKARDYLKQAADMQSTGALIRLAQLSLAENEPEDAVEWYEKAAALGDVKAMFELVVLYGDKTSKIHDNAKTAQWIEKAMASGKAQPSDMARIGEAYYRGLGVVQDSKKAAEWFYQSAKAGSAKGMRMLGRMYMEGNGVEQDRQVAVRWLAKAAEKGDLAAMVSVAEAYATGTGLPLDYDRASRFYRKAAQKGSTKAMREIGFLYMRGRGVERNESFGIQWLTSAAERGDVRAMEELARSYAAGFGVPESAPEALGWWKRAALAGSQEAKQQLDIATQTGYAPANFVRE